MGKILSQSGVSLADVYDVQGSIVGVEELDAESVKTVHEMGATIASERLGGRIFRVTTGDIAQSIAWNEGVSNLPNTPFRIMGVSVFADANRVNDASVLVRSTINNREIPIYLWDANEETIVARIQDDGAAVAPVSFLVSGLNVGTLPSMGLGNTSDTPVQEIAFRGTSTAFGAGTVEVVALVYILFTRTAGLSSYGLPIPGW